VPQNSIVPLNDLTRWDDEDLIETTKAIQSVVKSGYFVSGHYSLALEARIGELLGGADVVSVGNGTDALALSLLGLGISHGDEVATVGNAGGYATGAILRVGAIPKLVDVEVHTAQMSVSDFSNVVARYPNLKAVIVTHLYGLIDGIDAICSVAKNAGVLVIEDCAQSIGARANGRMAGSWGDAATFSFYPTKNLGALGDGGAVAFKKIEHADVARKLAQYGWSSRYSISMMGGFNSRLDEMQAAVLMSRFDKLHKNNLTRRSIVRRYANSLGISRRMIWRDCDSYIGHLAVMLTSTRAQDADNLHELGIQTGIHYPIPDHQQPAWTKCFRGVSLPNTELISQSILTLPCFPLMREEEISRVCSALSTI